jgi:hypothetical protein
MKLELQPEVWIMRNRSFQTSPAGLLLVLAASTFMHAQISLAITVGPPPIPVYDQPPCPEDGYTWAPGYWAWGDNGYFWIPGTWVRIPAAGMLWTPGYWGWGGAGMVFHTGYWGPQVGFYGGINYGFGYGGSGYEGGHWQGQNYYYNRSVTNMGSTHVTNVYNQTVVVNNNTYVSYNGGQGGVSAVPTRQERAAEQDHHVPPPRSRLSNSRAPARTSSCWPRSTAANLPSPRPGGRAISPPPT